MTLLSFDELNDISKQILANFHSFERFFDLDLQETDKSFIGCCPIHSGSDNQSAFVLYKNTGIWRCNTHGCHNVFKKSCIGLIRGLMSKERMGWKTSSDISKEFNFMATIKVATSIIENAPTMPINNRARHKKAGKKKVRADGKELKIPRRNFLDAVICPSQYYLDRGFDEDVLRKYCIGLYKRKYKQLSDRVLVPLFDISGEYIVGCSGRLPHDKCLICSGYHHSYDLCPDASQPWHFQKWKHNSGFSKTNYLYNYWSAKEHILNSGQVILVEGPSDCWRLEEVGIRNSLAILGSDITQRQSELINVLNPSNILTIMDNDEGGSSARMSCNRMLEGLDIVDLIPPKNDLGDMTKAEISNWLL